MILPQVKIMSLDSASIKLPLDREDVVFTNGCFDMLHYGHLVYLNEARQLGKVLVVAINSDESVQCLKGPSRPINSEMIRAYNLACLVCVDIVIVFNEDTPYKTLKKLQPGILVKGGDYNIEDIVGYDIVPKTIAVPYVNGFSTTDIINIIKSS